MQSRVASFAVWAAVAASLAYWGLTLGGPRTPLPEGARLPAAQSLASGDWSQVLGVARADSADDEEPAVANDGRFQLLGVVAPQGAAQSSQGVALIAVNQQPARPVRTGSVVDGDTVLLAVERRAVRLGPRGGPATVELTLPDPDSAARPAAPMAPHAMPGGAPMRPMAAGAAAAQAPGMHAAPVQAQQALQDMGDDEEEE